MDKVLTDFANMSAMIVEGLIKSVPEPESPLYWLMLGCLLMLLALLLMWLLVLMRRARLAKEGAATPAPEMTFSEVSAEAAAAAPGSADDAVAGGSEATVPAPATGEGSGFRFFKRKVRGVASKPSGDDPEDDVFLLGLEQEMLATRQLYLDGLISKEVYVTETRALYDKAQSRMT